MMQTIMNILDYEQFKIYGNEMVFKDDKLKKVDVKINSVGKKMVINNEKIENRKHIIVFGDILADVNMVQNVDYDTLICIGFLNKPRDPNDLKQYLSKYDMVIVNDGSFEEPIKMLR